MVITLVIFSLSAFLLSRPNTPTDGIVYTVENHGRTSIKNHQWTLEFRYDDSTFATWSVDHEANLKENRARDKRLDVETVKIVTPRDKNILCKENTGRLEVERGKERNAFIG